MRPSEKEERTTSHETLREDNQEGRDNLEPWDLNQRRKQPRAIPSEEEATTTSHETFVDKITTTTRPSLKETTTSHETIRWGDHQEPWWITMEPRPSEEETTIRSQIYLVTHLIKIYTCVSVRVKLTGGGSVSMCTYVCVSTCVCRKGGG